MNDGKSEPKEEDSQKESSSLSKKQDKLEKIEEIIDAIPEPERKEEAQVILREIKERYIERLPQDDPEILKILSESADKEGERKFRYLSQKQKDETDQERAELEFRKIKHANNFSLIKPVVYAVLALLVVCVGVGVWLCANGKETLGASLITGSISSVLSFAAGFGISGKFKDEKKPKSEE